MRQDSATDDKGGHTWPKLDWNLLSLEDKSEISIVLSQKTNGRVTTDMK
jgi:hypothetical protein